MGDRQEHDARTGPRQEGPQNGQQPEGQLLLGVPPQASRGGARSGRTPEASDSKLARRVPRSEPLSRDPLAGEHERKRLRPKTVDCLLDRLHGDMESSGRSYLHGPDHGMIRADRSTTYPPDGLLAKDTMVELEVTPP
jgi:hypothetical protein